MGGGFVAPTSPASPAFNDRLCAVEDLRFGEDVGDVISHGLLAQKQGLCDVRVIAAGRDQVEDLAFARGQLGKRLHGDALGCVEEGDQPRCDRRTEDRLPRRRGPDGPYQRSLVAALQHVAARPRSHRGEDRVVIFKHRQHENRHVRAVADDVPRGFDPGALRHLDVHDDNVRLELEGFCHRLDTVLGFRDDLESGSVSSAARRPRRNMGWSSAIRTRIRSPISPASGAVWPAPRTRACGRGDDDRSSDLFGALAHGDEANAVTPAHPSTVVPHLELERTVH